MITRIEGDHTFVLAEARDLRLVFTPGNGQAERLTVHQGGATVQGARKP